MFKNKVFIAIFSILLVLIMGVTGLVSYRLFPSFEKGVNRLFKIESISDENDGISDIKNDESNLIYKASFNVDGFTSESYYSVDEHIVFPDVPEKDGYKFKGWSVDGVNIIDYLDYSISSDTNFIALYRKPAFIAPPSRSLAFVDTGATKVVFDKFSNDEEMTYFIDGVNVIDGVEPVVCSLSDSPAPVYKYFIDNVCYYLASDLIDFTFSTNYTNSTVTDVVFNNCDFSSLTFITFSGASSLKSIDLSIFKDVSLTSLKNAFYNCSSLESIDLSCLDTSKVTDFSGLFDGCKKLHSIDVSCLNTSNALTFSNMFRACNDLESIDLSCLDTSKVTDFSGLFASCCKLKNIDLSTFNTSNATTLSGMFRDCNSLLSLDLSCFDTSSVTNLSSMFYRCYELNYVDLSSFITSKVTSFDSMFYECSSLIELDISSFSKSSMNDNDYWFYKCSNLSVIYVSDTWCQPGELCSIRGSETFSDCSKLVNYDSVYETGLMCFYGSYNDNGEIVNGYFTLKEK